MSNLLSWFHLEQKRTSRRSASSEVPPISPVPLYFPTSPQYSSGNMEGARSPLYCPASPQCSGGNTERARSPLYCPTSPRYSSGNEDGARSPLYCPEGPHYSNGNKEGARSYVYCPASPQNLSANKGGTSSPICYSTNSQKSNVGRKITVEPPVEKWEYESVMKFKPPHRGDLRFVDGSGKPSSEHGSKEIQGEKRMNTGNITIMNAVSFLENRNPSNSGYNFTSDDDELPDLDLEQSISTESCRLIDFAPEIRTGEKQHITNSFVYNESSSINEDVEKMSTFPQVGMSNGGSTRSPHTDRGDMDLVNDQESSTDASVSNPVKLPSNKPVPISGKPLKVQCPMCERTLSSLWHLNAHKGSKICRRRCTCPVNGCGRLCATFSRLVEHIETCHSDCMRTRSLCLQCVKLVKKCRWEKHLLTHSKRKITNLGLPGLHRADTKPPTPNQTDQKENCGSVGGERESDNSVQDELVKTDKPARGKGRVNKSGPSTSALKKAMKISPPNYGKKNRKRKSLKDDWDTTDEDDDEDLDSPDLCDTTDDDDLDSVDEADDLDDDSTVHENQEVHMLISEVDLSEFADENGFIDPSHLETMMDPFALLWKQKYRKVNVNRCVLARENNSDDRPKRRYRSEAAIRRDEAEYAILNAKKASQVRSDSRLQTKNARSTMKIGRSCRSKVKAMSHEAENIEPPTDRARCLENTGKIRNKRRAKLGLREVKMNQAYNRHGIY